MRIKMKTMMAGPDVHRNIGEVVEVGETEGCALVSGGYAEDVTPKAAPVEVAAIAPAETATAPAQNKRRGR